SAELSRRRGHVPEDNMEDDITPKILFTCTIHDSISVMLNAAVGSHDTNSPFVVPFTDDHFASLQTGIFCVCPSKGSCALVSAHGNKSKILSSLCAIQGATTSYAYNTETCCLVLQGQSCLSCTFDLAKQKYR